MYMLDLCTTVFRYLSFDLTFWTSPWEKNIKLSELWFIKDYFEKRYTVYQKKLDINYDTMCKALSLSLSDMFLLKISSPDMQICFCSNNYHLVHLIHCMVSVFFFNNYSCFCHAYLYTAFWFLYFFFFK